MRNETKAVASGCFSGLGSRVSGLGSRVSGLGSRVSWSRRADVPATRVQDFCQSEAWAFAQSVIANVVRSRVAARDREDLVSEATLLLLQAVGAGRAIDNLAGYASRVTISALRRWRGRQEFAGVDAGSVAAETRGPSFDELVARPGLDSRALRGATQKKLAVGVSTGVSHEELAAELGLLPRVVRLQMRRLARLLSAG